LIELLEGALVCGTLIGVIIWALVAVAGPHVNPTRVAPARRSATARAWLYAPIWIPIFVIGSTLAPGAIGALAQVGEACLTHGNAGHHHLCTVHAPHAAGWIIAFGLLAPATIVTLVTAVRTRQEWRLVKTLNALSRPSSFGPDVRLLDRPEPVAMTLGWRTPTILLSSGLVENIPAASVRVVIAHERAHVVRRDTWFSIFDRFAATLLPRHAAQALTGQILLAREQACDAAAARVGGGEEAVATALTDILKLGAPVLHHENCASSEPLRSRIDHLLNPPEEPRFGRFTPAVALAIGMLVGAGPVHLVVERFVSVFLHQQ
jgi:hypothetical protein